MVSVKWKGSRSLLEQSESPVIDFGAEETTVTMTFEAPFDVCVASRPTRGSELAHYPGIYVDKSTVRRLEGGKGRLEIIASGASESAESRNSDPTYEVDWVELQRPLIQHPIYWYSGGLVDFGAFQMFPQTGWGGITHELIPDDIVALGMWEDCPDHAIKSVARYYTDNAKRTPPGGAVLSGSAMHYAVKRMAGIESFQMHTPVLKLKIESSTIPSTSGSVGCDMRWSIAQLEDLGFQEIPSLDADTPYEWLKTADHATRTGRRRKYEWNREWTGATHWDHDLYLEYS